jgi:hypothetical protein
MPTLHAIGVVLSRCPLTLRFVAWCFSMLQPCCFTSFVAQFGAVGLDESLRFELRKQGATGVYTTCVCPVSPYKLKTLECPSVGACVRCCRPLVHLLHLALVSGLVYTLTC